MSHLDKFNPTVLMVAEHRYWIVTTRSKQVTPGDLVVLPRSAYEHFGAVEAEAAVELLAILGQLEKVALGELGANRINVVAAMMKDPFVHFHFFPRFEGAVDRFGTTWIDEDWPRAIRIRDVETPGEVLAGVTRFYAEHLDSHR